MAGHSKWSQIKRQKAVNDIKRSQAFVKLSREIINAGRAGGVDVETNSRLALLLEKAKKSNMPKSSIENALKSASGVKGDELERAMYEGYGPAGVAVLIDALTDKRTRTTQNIRTILSKAGGSLGTTGCVARNFEQKGVFAFEDVTKADDIMEIALENGAEDVSVEADAVQVFCVPTDFMSLKKCFEEKGLIPSYCELEMQPQNMVEIDDPEIKETITDMLEELDDHPDVQTVYHNAQL